MENDLANVKVGYHAYPEARKGPETNYDFDDGQVPVMRGRALDLSGVLSVGPQIDICRSRMSF